VEAALPPAPLYFVVVAARNAARPIAAGSGVSLFSDRNDAELLRMDREAAEVIRLDRLLGERDAALERQAAHVRHLEDIAAIQRDAHRVALTGALHERDEAAQALASARQAVGALCAEIERLERARAAQERIIAYRQSARWWLALPWLRVKLWWQRMFK
jgi:chromosome segregation ATPase